MNKRILILGDANSIHIKKWIFSLAKTEGLIVALFSLSEYQKEDQFYQRMGVELTSPVLGPVNKKPGAWSKIFYLKSIPLLKKFILKFSPHIIHAHYASSYGFLAMLTGFKPFYLSVWGSDIYLFPKKSWLHQRILSQILKRSDYIFSASEALAKETKKYIRRPIQIIPFGVDTNIFRPLQSPFQSETIIIGCIKGLWKIYGIDYLIRAFYLCHQIIPHTQLWIYGDGDDKTIFENLVQKFDLQSQVIFKGFVDHNNVAEEYNKIDIPVFMSRSESFGVSAVEAMACGRPIIVSRVGGLPELFANETEGFIVPSGDFRMASQKMIQLIKQKEQSIEMGQRARERVLAKYDWKDSLKKQIKFYEMSEAK